MPPSPPHAEDALKFLVDYLRNPPSSSYSSYGYTIYLSNVAREFIFQTTGAPRNNPADEGAVDAISAPFLDAAWELCRRGILRPSVKNFRGQGVDNGQGYSVTEVGARWVKEGREEFFNLGAERLKQLLEPYAARLGSPFLRRAIEASDCHMGHTYLACCAMCGAAAESVLLAVAIAKTGDRDRVLGEYKAANGRRRVLNTVIGQSPQEVARPFESMMGLLSYWRDDAAHGLESSITELEAHEALTRLVRLAQFASDRWDDLTRGAQ